ncbi:FMN-binding protein, partial [Carnobacterium sp.]|uniref:FMN-binding protein n=1 Tax=Carnobacterium sp. TaxID=48221 RepID=UPI0028AB5261
YLDKDGNLKSEDEEYQKAMKEKSGTGPAEYIPELNAELVAKGDPADVEVVTGATHSSESFKKYAQQLVDAAKEGKTETIMVDNQVEE